MGYYPLFLLMDYYADLEKKIGDYLIPVLRVKGYELIELAISVQGSKLHLKCLIDKVGGITMAECVTWNKKIAQILDRNDFIKQSYILEVSSPGLDRPLKKVAQFKCALGEDLIVEMQDGRIIEGRLSGINGSKIIIAQGDKVQKVLLSNIERARKKIKFQEAQR